MAEMSISGYVNNTYSPPRKEVQNGLNGASYVIQQGGTWDYGNWPNNRYVNGVAVVPASASGVLIYEALDVTTFNGFVFEVYAIGGTTPVIKLHASLDGTNYAATLPRLVDLSNGTLIAGATGVSAVGIYGLEIPTTTRMKFKSLKLVQTGGASDQTCSVRYAHIWM